MMEHHILLLFILPVLSCSPILQTKVEAALDPELRSSNETNSVAIDSSFATKDWIDSRQHNIASPPPSAGKIRTLVLIEQQQRHDKMDEQQQQHDKMNKQRQRYRRSFAIPSKCIPVQKMKCKMFQVGMIKKSFCLSYAQLECTALDWTPYLVWQKFDETTRCKIIEYNWLMK